MNTKVSTTLLEQLLGWFIIRLDLLLTLARNQKVDIAKISILKLADQYLEFKTAFLQKFQDTV